MGLEHKIKALENKIAIDDLQEIYETCEKVIYKNDKIKKRRYYSLLKKHYLLKEEDLLKKIADAEAKLKNTYENFYDFKKEYPKILATLQEIKIKKIYNTTINSKNSMTVQELAKEYNMIVKYEMSYHEQNRLLKNLIKNSMKYHKKLNKTQNLFEKILDLKNLIESIRVLEINSNLNLFEMCPNKRLNKFRKGVLCFQKGEFKKAFRLLKNLKIYGTILKIFSRDSDNNSSLMSD